MDVNFLVIITMLVVIGLLYKPVSVLIYKILPIASDAKNAKVIHKDIWGGGEFKSAPTGRGMKMTTSNGYRMTFEFDDLTTVTLVVPKRIYYGLSVNSKGLLDYHGKTFVKFKVIEGK
ncbi:MAG: hypothetical protein FWF15_03695 [Oscillospiraceae bacterium]|nr:hypothetical protein [Oscillospiraceae bacterium]